MYFYDDALKGLGSRNANILSFVVCTRNYNLFITITRLCNIFHGCKIDKLAAFKKLPIGYT